MADPNETEVMLVAILRQLEACAALVRMLLEANRPPAEPEPVIPETMGQE